MQGELLPSPPVTGTGTKVYLEALCFPNGSKGVFSSTYREHQEAQDNTQWWVLIALESRIRTVSKINETQEKKTLREVQKQEGSCSFTVQRNMFVFIPSLWGLNGATLQHVQLAHPWTLSTCIGCRMHWFHRKIFIRAVGRLFVCTFQVIQTSSKIS